MQDEIIDLLQALANAVERHEKRIDQLYANFNVRKGWNLGINKEKIDYMLEINQELGVTAKKRDTQIIISLTSYPARMYDIKYTLYSLLHQSLKPDRIILWLAKEQFPGGENDIAPSLLELQKYGLEIRWCEDIKSYKKLIPALMEFPDDILVTADDDIYYPENWLELLYNSYLKQPDCIHCHRAHRMKGQEGELLPYKMWDYEGGVSVPSYCNFPTGCGGVLYPNGSLHKEVTNKEMFMKLAPNADDVWFWAMAVLNNKKMLMIQEGHKSVTCVNWAREIGLCEETTLAVNNTGEKAENDIQLNSVLRQYPVVLDVLKTDNLFDD